MCSRRKLTRVKPRQAAETRSEPTRSHGPTVPRSPRSHGAHTAKASIIGDLGPVKLQLLLASAHGGEVGPGPETRSQRGGKSRPGISSSFIGNVSTYQSISTCLDSDEASRKRRFQATHAACQRKMHPMPKSIVHHAFVKISTHRNFETDSPISQKQLLFPQTKLNLLPSSARSCAWQYETEAAQLVFDS